MITTQKEIQKPYTSLEEKYDKIKNFEKNKKMTTDAMLAFLRDPDSMDKFNVWKFFDNLIQTLDGVEILPSIIPEPKKDKIYKTGPPKKPNPSEHNKPKALSVEMGGLSKPKLKEPPKK